MEEVDASEVPPSIRDPLDGSAAVLDPQSDSDPDVSLTSTNEAEGTATSGAGAAAGGGGAAAGAAASSGAATTAAAARHSAPADTTVSLESGRMSVVDNDMLVVDCSNPERHGEGMLDSYVAYTVNTKTNRPQFGGDSFTVLRRYSDFDWLREILCHEMPHCVVPPMPSKHQLKAGKFDPPFLEKRRACLDRFLKRIASHPLLSNNDTFRMFLTAKAHELTTLKKDKERSVVDKMQESMNLMAAKYVKNPDPRYVRLHEYLTALESKVKPLETANDRTLFLQRELKNIVSEFAVAFNALSEIEDVLGPSLAQFHKSVSEMVQQQGTVIEKFDNLFAEPIKEYALYCEVVRLLVRRRDHTHLHKQQLEDSLAQKRLERAELEGSDQKMSIGALFGKDPASVKTDKLEKNQADIDQLARNVEQASNALEIANASVDSDYERWTDLKNADFLQAFNDLADANIEFFEQQIKSWDKVTAELEKL